MNHIIYLHRMLLYVYSVVVIAMTYGLYRMYSGTRKLGCMQIDVLVA